MRPNYRIPKFETTSWMLTRISETLQITRALSELINVEFARAWGEPGVPGVDTLIVATCRLFSGVCVSAIEWEEAVRFANLDEIFEELQGLLIGIAGGLINEAAKVPEYLGTVFANDPKPGEYRLNLVIELPESWSDAVNAALARVTEAILADA
jgi:hypothetical protein